MSLPFHFPFETPLLPGTLLRRYHRFLSDVRLEDGSVVVAHCVNSGSMEGLARPGAKIWLSPATAPDRKLKWTWEISEEEGRLVGANTARPNQVVKALLEARALEGFRSCRGFKPEQKYGERSRIDFLVDTAKGPHYIEVKNCHLVYEDRIGYFPDSVSERAAKHLLELASLAKKGSGTTVLFFVQRGDATSVRPSDAHDPEFAKAARKAKKAGVKFRALRIEPSLTGLTVAGEIPVDLETYPLDDIRRWRDARRPFSGWERPKKASVDAVQEAAEEGAAAVQNELHADADEKKAHEERHCV